MNDYLPYWQRSQALDELGRTAAMEDRYGPVVPVRSAPAPAEDGKAKRVVLKVKARQNGRILTDRSISVVRVDDGAYRPAKNPDFDAALRWLEKRGFEFVRCIRPRGSGWVDVVYIYEREA